MVTYECPECGYRTERKSSYTYHTTRRIKTCKNRCNGEHECKYCGKSFSSSSNLNKHIRKVCKGELINIIKEEVQKEVSKQNMEDDYLVWWN